ncbi:hypothetical protein niasHT_031312 [Heterodera trifolii]|uniref:Uncharacterized protein n=1 Tax=Heterodera trifolii TaxID=157864 RepID=A0ABD2IRF0_9BILA
MLSSSSSSAPEEGELDEDVAEENQPIIQQQRFDLLKSSSQRDILTQARAEVGDDLLDSPGVIIPDRLRQITIFDGHEEGRRLIVFMSEFGRNLITNYGSHIAMDGTFKVAPSPFTQLYNISVLIDFVAVPAVYALLQSKSTAQYARVQNLPGLNERFSNA